MIVAVSYSLLVQSNLGAAALVFPDASAMEGIPAKRTSSSDHYSSDGLTALALAGSKRKMCSQSLPAAALKVQSWLRLCES